MKISPTFIDYLMSEAIAEAKVSGADRESPIGAVIARDELIIARAGNRVESQQDPTAHAELIAIQKASKSSDNWRLDSCIIAVTLEPCTMCYGAISLARIPVVIFGASDNKIGALGSRYDLSLSDDNNRRIIRGIKERECAALLSEFFTLIRNKSNGTK